MKAMRQSIFRFRYLICLLSLGLTMQSCEDSEDILRQDQVPEILDIKNGKAKQVAYLKVNTARITDALQIRLKLNDDEKASYIAPLFADIAIVFESAKLIPSNSPKLRGEGVNVSGRVALAFKEWYISKEFSPSARSLDRNTLYNSNGSQNLNPDAGGDPGHYSLTMNEELQNDIKELKKNGLIVLLDILPDHEDAGWNSFQTSDEAFLIAKQMNDAINNYGFDGIDIDEEYARYVRSFPGSMTRVLDELTKIWNSEDAKHPGKKLIISKALWSDSRDFSERVTVDNNGTDKIVSLVDYLTDGWEMTYSVPARFRLNTYLGYGMRKENLGIGFDFTLYGSFRINDENDALNNSRFTQENDFGYLMIYDLKKTELHYYSIISNTLYKRDVEIVED